MVAADPHGYVNLGTAENHLLFDLLAPRLAAARTVTAADTEYQLMQGMQSFRAELARFLGRQRGVAVDPSTWWCSAAAPAPWTPLRTRCATRATAS